MSMCVCVFVRRKYGVIKLASQFVFTLIFVYSIVSFASLFLSIYIWFLLSLFRRCNFVANKNSENDCLEKHFCKKKSKTDVRK